MYTTFCLSLFVILTTFAQCAEKNDFIALNLRLVNESNYKALPTVYNLYYRQLKHWEEVTRIFSESFNLDVDYIQTQVQSHLEKRMYDIERLRSSTEPDDKLFDSHNAVSLLLKGLKDVKLPQELFLSNNKHIKHNTKRTHFTTSNTDDNATLTIGDIISDWLHPNYTSKLPSFLLSSESSSSPPIIIYNSLGVSTGGTTAMNILYETLLKMGFNVLLCNDNNRYTAKCRRPSDFSLIVTGEWCNEVLQEYLDAELPPELLQHEVSAAGICDTTTDAVGKVCSSPHSSDEQNGKHSFLGRGVQYYLGFHHNDDSCRGRPAIGDSHYMNQLIGRRLLGAYYLGCPMTRGMKSAYEFIVTSILQQEGGENEGEEEEMSVHVEKENLLLIDPDYTRDYPPENQVVYQAPSGWRVLYVQDIPSHEMPLILQRAKIVLDLGMPGPERISGEALLFGCIPVVSERWNGASRVDFPGIRRVNPFEGAQITKTLDYIALHYEDELKETHNAQFLQYILSLDNKLIHTADAVFGSSRVHFLLTADTLKQEYMLTFQVLALLYMYPLCSVDIYVHDVMWFIRHHYVFYDILKSAGYVRVDPLHPTDFSGWRHHSGGQAFVNIRQVVLLRQELLGVMLASSEEGVLKTIANNTHIPLLIPSWKPLLVVLKGNVLFRNPEVLFEWMRGMESNSVRNVKVSAGFETSAANAGAKPRGVITLCDDFVDSGESCDHHHGSSLALLISPHAVLTPHVMSELLNSLSVVVDEDDSLMRQDVVWFDTSKDVTTVCDLLTHSDREDRDVIDGIGRSIPWSTLRIFVEQLDAVNC